LPVDLRWIWASVRDVERRLQMPDALSDKPKPKSPIDAVKAEERLQVEETWRKT
jgi:hypothetical protein